MKKSMKTYMYIQVAYPIIVKQNWRGVAEARGGGDGGKFCDLEYE